jgi:GNAT acetyltransferase
MSESRWSDYDLMKIHVRALYVHDGQSRILSVNDWRGGAAPRFFLGRTIQGNIWRFRYDLPDQVCKDLASLCRQEPASLSASPEFEADYIRLLSTHAPVNAKWSGPAYYFPGDIGPHSQAVQLAADESGLLRESMPEWLPDVAHQQPFIARVVSGRAVAVCASVRITEDAHEAGVETLENHQRKGYAVAVVSSWASVVANRGVIPLYSTSFSNSASQNLAMRLGLSRYGVDFHLS